MNPNDLCNTTKKSKLHAYLQYPVTKATIILTSGDSAKAVFFPLPLLHSVTVYSRSIIASCMVRFWDLFNPDNHTVNYEIVFEVNSFCTLPSCDS